MKQSITPHGENLVTTWHNHYVQVSQCRTPVARLMRHFLFHKDEEFCGM